MREPIDPRVDIGHVHLKVADIERSLGFYRDVLGFEDLGEMPMPGGTMHRLMCGTSAIKIVTPRKAPPGTAPPGGIQGATGYRYWTISVGNLEEIVADCEAAGRTVAVPVTDLRGQGIEAVVFILLGLALLRAASHSRY